MLKFDFKWYNLGNKLVYYVFQDGYHMGLFFNKSQQNIDNLKIDKNLVKVR